MLRRRRTSNEDASPQPRDSVTSGSGRGMLADLLGPGIDLLGGGIGLLDADGRILHANPALGELLGAPHNSLVGQSLRAHAHPDDQSAVQSAFDPSHASHEVEWRCPRSDGRVLHLLQVTTTVADTSGLAPHFLAQFTDVSRSRQIEFALRRQTELYESLVEGLDVLGEGVAVVDDSSVLFVNPALARMLGYAQEELVGQPWPEELVPREQRPWWRRMWQVTTLEDVPDRYDLTLLRRDGRELEVEVTIRQVRPETALRLLVVRDVSERNHRIGEQLQLAAIAEASSDAIGSVDSDGCVTRWNPRAEAIFERQFSDVVGTRFVELFPEATRALVESGLARAQAGEIVRQLDIDAIGDDEGVDMSMSMSPLRDTVGDVIGVAIVARDVTEQRRLERDRARFAERLQIANKELEHANQVRSEFVSMASHELRTPLTTIHGFARTMLDLWEQVSDEEKQRYLGIVDSQALRLSRLVDNLLTASRFESGRSSLHPRSYEVREELERIVGPLGIDELELRCPDDLTITSDPDHLEQIVVNLVINAQKYGQAPYVVDAALSAPSELTVRVCDSGSGVEGAFVPHLFESFTRSPSATAREVEGAGLGLAIVRWLAEESGGRAWYEPNQPRGACFCVTLQDFGAGGHTGG